MFEKETLFILGAGASVPYGYPVGPKLITNIIEDMEDKILLPIQRPKSGGWEKIGDYYFNKHDKPYDLNDFLESYDYINQKFENEKDSRKRITGPINGGEEGPYYRLNFNSSPYVRMINIEHIKQFRELKLALETFNPISIDIFLRDNPSHAQVGKTMINYSLLKRESLQKFRVENRVKKKPEDKKEEKDDWYRYLLNDMLSGCVDDAGRILKNKINFITFNYDLSLDYYLYDRLTSTERFQQDGGGKQFLKELHDKRIHHVYGQLYPHDEIERYGSLGPDNASDDKVKDNFRRFLFALRNEGRIKTIQGERDERGQAERFKGLLDKADEIIIMGFSFDRDNLNQIGFPSSPEGYSTMFEGKAIKILNFDGRMTHLSQECKKIIGQGVLLEDKPSFRISTATNITNAYINDFKAHLLE